MQPLSDTDLHRLNAAKGWLELGSVTEANNELEQVTPCCKIHPDVLELRWQIYGKMRWWTTALELANAMIELAPERSAGWIFKAYSLHKLERTQKACDLLLEIEEMFSDLATIPFFLACFHCHLDRREEAWVWLKKAIARGNPVKMATLALDESELKPLWDRVALHMANRDSVVAPRPAIESAWLSTESNACARGQLPAGANSGTRANLE